MSVGKERVGLSFEPEMSVLILTPGGFELIRETVRHLSAQTARERLELVVVAPSREALGHFEPEASGFARGKKWTRLRRLAYVGGGPLIPLVRVRRALPEVYRTGARHADVARVLPAMLAGLIPHALGEVAGYAFGAGPSEERYSSFEMNRSLHVTERDRRELAARAADARQLEEVGV